MGVRIGGIVGGGGKPKKETRREIALGDDFGDVTVSVNGARVVIDADGGVQVLTGGRGTIPASANSGGSLISRAKPEAPVIGALVPGKGVFLGVWTPKDRDGRSLNKTFNLFAAPHDLGLDESGQGQKLVTTYRSAMEAVGRITNLMGHDGAKYKNNTELYSALADGSYRGEWFIPTKDLVNGTDPDGNKVQNDNLYRHRNAGTFTNTFRTAGASVSDFAPWYWSCTERPDNSSYVWAVDFTDGHDAWAYTDNHELSVRPVRAEPLPPA